MNLSMGSTSTPSILGTKLCGIYYWAIQVLYLALCGCVTVYAVKLNQKECKIRKRFGINFIPGEIEYEGQVLKKLMIISFCGGMVAGALGLGGGSIYNPALLSLGVDPRVAGSTGMYLVLFGTINSCVINFVNGTLDFYYGLWLGLWSVFGAGVGLFLTEMGVKKYGRPSIFVWLLFSVFLLSIVITPIFSYIQLAESYKIGDKLFAFTNPC
jgi:hypothetical protein